MVKSGLEEVEVGSGAGYGGYDIPRVSPYRLATHLTSAFAIYSLIMWTGFTVLRETPYLASRAPAEIADAMRPASTRAFRHSASLTHSLYG